MFQADRRTETSSSRPSRLAVFLQFRHGYREGAKVAKKKR
jgi:hypothetical protein